MTTETYRDPSWSCGFLSEHFARGWLFDAPWHYPWGSYKRVQAGQRVPAQVFLPHGTYWGEDHREFCRNVLALDPCAYCGDPVECIDHIHPKANGGDNDWTNFTAACRRCNQSKKAAPLLLYLLRRQGIRPPRPSKTTHTP